MYVGGKRGKHLSSAAWTRGESRGDQRVSQGLANVKPGLTTPTAETSGDAKAAGFHIFILQDGFAVQHAKNVVGKIQVLSTVPAAL